MPPLMTTIRTPPYEPRAANYPIGDFCIRLEPLSPKGGESEAESYCILSDLFIPYYAGLYPGKPKDGVPGKQQFLADTEAECIITDYGTEDQASIAACTQTLLKFAPHDCQNMWIGAKDNWTTVQAWLDRAALAHPDVKCSILCPIESQSKPIQPCLQSYPGRDFNDAGSDARLSLSAVIRDGNPKYPQISLRLMDARSIVIEPGSPEREILEKATTALTSVLNRKWFEHTEISLLKSREQLIQMQPFLDTGRLLIATEIDEQCDQAIRTYFDQTRSILDDDCDNATRLPRTNNQQRPTRDTTSSRRTRIANHESHDAPHSDRFHPHQSPFFHFQAVRRDVCRL